MENKIQLEYTQTKTVGKYVVRSEIMVINEYVISISPNGHHGVDKKNRNEEPTRPHRIFNIVWF